MFSEEAKRLADLWRDLVFAGEKAKAQEVHETLVKDHGVQPEHVLTEMATAVPAATAEVPVAETAAPVPEPETPPVDAADVPAAE